MGRALVAPAVAAAVGCEGRAGALPTRSLGRLEAVPFAPNRVTPVHAASRIDRSTATATRARTVLGRPAASIFEGAPMWSSSSWRSPIRADGPNAQMPDKPTLVIPRTGMVNPDGLARPARWPWMTSQSRGRRPACDQRPSRVDCPASGYPLPPQRSPMPRSPRALRTTLTMLVVLVATTESPASAWSPSPRTVSQGVRPGAVIAVGGLRFVVPPPGMGVGAEALLAGGGERSATVRTLADGTVVTWARSWPGGAAIAPPSTPFDKCADGGYALNSSDWSRIYRWRFRSRSTPQGVKRY